MLRLNRAWQFVVNSIRRSCSIWPPGIRLQRVLDMKHLAGKLNYADMLTKPLARDVFYSFSDAVLNGKIYFTSFAPSASAFSMLSELLSYLKAP